MSYRTKRAYYGLSVDKQQMRRYADSTIVNELHNIIRTRDIVRLGEFSKRNPEMTLYHGHSSTCMCGCSTFSSPIDNILMSRFYDDDDSTLNVIGSTFFDALFEYGYIFDNDIYIIYNMLLRMGDYEKWDDVNYLLKKMNPVALKSCFKDNENDSLISGIADAFYWCHTTHYYGKICRGAIECFKILKELGIVPHDDENDGIETSHESQTQFWNIEASISSFQNNRAELFKARNLVYWDSLPSSYQDIIDSK